MRAYPCLIILLAIGGCTTAEGDLVLRDGYLSPEDDCKAVGRWFSNSPTDSSPDLVACPPEATPIAVGSTILSIGEEDGYDIYYVVP